MIHFTNAGHTFKNGTVGLADINLQIDAGEFVYIVGESGAGKSTLTKLVLRELVATQGTIRVDGVDLAKLKKRRLPYYRRKIGFVFRTSVCSPTARPGRMWLLPANASACRVVRL